MRAGDESSNNEKKTEESGHGGLGDKKLASFELCKIPVRLESGPKLIPLSGSNDLANIDWRLFLDRSISGQSEKVSATHMGKFVFSVILFFLSVKKQQMEEITLSGRDVYVSVLGFVATLNFQ